MKISELVTKLEEIEKESDGKARRLCGTLIDDLIEWDMEMTRVMKKVNSKVLKHIEAEEDEFIKFLMKEGIESGSIGEA
tara:strand:- start:205 stop:441 length:237 start_codon:yes stop_codon:yes gene_type:complete